MKSRIGKQDSKEIGEILTRIDKLFDRYYALPHTAPAEDNIVGDLYEEVGLLRDNLWHQVDAKTAQIMDDVDGFARNLVRQSRHPSTGFSEPKN